MILTTTVSVTVELDDPEDDYELETVIRALPTSLMDYGYCIEFDEWTVLDESEDA